MARQDATGTSGHVAISQDELDATPSAPSAVDVSSGLKGGFLISVNSGITLSGANRIDFKAYKGEDAAEAEAATNPIVSEDIGGDVTITGAIIASAQDDAEALAGYFIPYVGDEAFVTVIPTFEGTHGAASAFSIQYVILDKENKQ